MSNIIYPSVTNINKLKPSNGTVDITNDVSNLQIDFTNSSDNSIKLNTIGKIPNVNQEDGVDLIIESADGNSDPLKYTYGGNLYLNAGSGSYTGGDVFINGASTKRGGSVWLQAGSGPDGTGFQSSIRIRAGTRTGISSPSFLDIYPSHITASSLTSSFSGTFIGVPRLSAKNTFTMDQILSGNLLIPNGNGINFGAVAGVNSNGTILDDYEEGTFTTSGNVFNGRYIKIGSCVSIFASGSYSTSFVTGFSCDTFIATGLPYASIGVASFGASLTPVYENPGSTSINLFIHAYVLDNTNSINFQIYTLRDTNFNSPLTRTIYLSGVYYTNS